MQVGEGGPSTSVTNVNGARRPYPRSFSGGYRENVFEGHQKQAQMEGVKEYLIGGGWVPESLVDKLINHFYELLGIDAKYFIIESKETIGRHILALYGAQINAYTRGENTLEINLANETETGAVYIHNSQPGVSIADGPQVERRIDTKYLDSSWKEKAYRLESYRSSSTDKKLRCYFITKCNFVTPPAGSHPNAIEYIADEHFLEKATRNTLQLYQDIIDEVSKHIGPVITVHDLPNDEKRVIIGYAQKTTENFFSSFSDLYHYYRLYSTRKYVEQFSNGVTIMSVYLNRLDKGFPDSEHPVTQVVREASLIYCLPATPLQTFFQTSQLSIQAVIYGYVGWIFAQHFLNRLGTEYASLASFLSGSDPLQTEVLSKIKKRLRSDTFTRDYILDIIREYPDLIQMLYVNFALRHYQAPTEPSIPKSLSYQRLQPAVLLPDKDILEHIRKRVQNAHELLVFESFLTFNKHVLKTNFFHPRKVALSFRVDPAFLPASEYQTRLIGMFMVVGSEFRGFHLRFRDVARGGIRIITSRNREAYSINLRSLFDENYNLALTQQRKNKDIPEGGSKGTILIDFAQQSKPRVAFEKYVDSILDLLLAPETSGVTEITKYIKPEILFFGPDEGTAEYMDWASAHARRRGAPFWKAFTTGKSQSMGGIPHDLFGMTTRSIRQYVKGIYEKCNLRESDCTKFQTGGPDGDLGSNEIKLSTEKYLGIVDGSGVLYDPKGLDQKELRRLAGARKMIKEYDTKLLSNGGFQILVEHINIEVPGLGLVESGFKFRNEFHLHPLSSSLVFVPCGGRPEAVDINNVSQCFDEHEKPKWKYVVEGANLFFTQEARLRLEKSGVVIIKDASANKGGVTSSSLEVLAALSFSDEEFEKNMTVKNGVVPDFYREYITTVHAVIEGNARNEFECLWREHQRTGRAFSHLTDDVSNKIVRLNEELQHTSLWDNRDLRIAVLQKALPNILLRTVGIEKLMQRVPDAYLRAVFGSYLASHFVYHYGTDPSYFAFFEYMNEFMQGSYPSTT